MPITQLDTQLQLPTKSEAHNTTSSSITAVHPHDHASNPPYLLLKEHPSRYPDNQFLRRLISSHSQNGNALRSPSHSLYEQQCLPLGLLALLQTSIGTGYDLANAIFSPDGRNFQVEYAIKAVENGGTTVGIRCKDGVVLAVEKIVSSKLLKPGANKRIATVDRHVGVVCVACPSNSISSFLD